MFKADFGITPIKWSQQYACTLTLHPKVRKYTAEEQYEMFAHQLVNVLQTKFPNIKLTLVCELTKTYDIHFHGIISFDLSSLRKNQNLARMFRDTFRGHPYIGFVLLKQITEDVVWNEYILKSTADFETDINKYPVLIDNHKIYHKD